MAVKAMQEALLKAHFYPDGGGYHLRVGIAEKFGVSIDNVMLGNGSNEIIEFLGHAFLQPGDNIVTAEHAFVVYKILAKLFGAETIEVPDPNLTHDLPAMADAINDRTKIVYIANPNNPTGTMVSEKELDRFIDRVPSNVVVALDEAYYEFLPNPPDTLEVYAQPPERDCAANFFKDTGFGRIANRLRIGARRIDQLAAENQAAVQCQFDRPSRRVGRAAGRRISGENQGSGQSRGGIFSRQSFASANWSMSRAWPILSWSMSARGKRYSKNCSNEG